MVMYNATTTEPAQKWRTPPTLAETSGDTQAAAEILAQFRRYQQSHSLPLRDELARRHLPLVYAIARRYARANEPFEDLVQEGAIGLLKAIENFDPERGMCFSTFAYPIITHQITHYLRDYGYLIRQPARKQELNYRVARTIERLTQQLDRPPRTAELAGALDIAESVVERILEKQQLNHILSLTPAEDAAAPDQLLDTAARRQWRRQTSLTLDDRIALNDAMRHLPGRELRIVQHYFFENLTLAEIAARYAMTIPRIASLLRSALRKLKLELSD